MPKPKEYIAKTKIELPGVRGDDGGYTAESQMLNPGESISAEDLMTVQSDEDIAALISDGALEEA